VHPKLYRTSHPRAPFLVVFTDPQGKQIRRNFKDEEQAKAYHRELLAKAKVVGTVGLVMDQEMRAEYFAARKLLDGVPLLTAVRYFLSHRPVGLASTTLVEALQAFIRDKQRSGRAERTVRSLESTLSAFLADSPARLVSDFTREAVLHYLDGLRLPPLTIRNHRARLSTFGSWLARRQYLPENPVSHIEVAKHDLRPPRVFTPQEAELVMKTAKEYRDGIFAPMYAIALFAGLRLGEILRLTWGDVHLDDKSPIIRVGRGKIRGRRAVRVVPIEPALLSWLKWAKEKDLPLVNPSSDSRKIREVVEWQEDICRHSWISYRLAMTGDEVRVAREAGNSPDVIYRHYFQLVSRRDAVRYFSNFGEIFFFL
jgi:integrase